MTCTELEGVKWYLMHSPRPHTETWRNCIKLFANFMRDVADTAAKWLEMGVSALRQRVRVALANEF